MSVTDKRSGQDFTSHSRDAHGWHCAKCGKRHLGFRKECGNYRRCVECDHEALDFARGLCGACYQRTLRRESRRVWA
jgi:hypothetical protein